MKRREFLTGIVAARFVPALDFQPSGGSRLVARGVDGQALERVEVVADATGTLIRPRVVNRGALAVRVKDVVVFDRAYAMPASTALYGEGFQMLTQTAGTVSAPVDLSQYTDAKHYKIPASIEERAHYGLVTLTPPGD